MSNDTCDQELWLLIKRGLYYRTNGQGYTAVKDGAHLYTQEDAAKRCDFVIYNASEARPGDHENVYAIPNGKAPMYLPAGFSDVIAEHASNATASLTAERDAAIARATEAEAAHEDAMRGCLHTLELLNAAETRAEAAEAQVERLREAAKPFVEFEKTMRLWKTGNVASWGPSTIQEAVPDWEVLLKGSYPIDEPTSQSVIVRAAHIRALARAALAGKEPADG